MRGRAVRIGFCFPVTAYDACYIAAASLAGMPFITADKKLANSITGRKRPSASTSAIEVIWLGEMEA